jgi:sec-independent protein translocase protein TatA
MEGIIAPWHIAIVLVIALFVFGPKKLPELGQSLGKSISGFRRGMQDTRDELSGVMTEAAEAAQPVETPAAEASAQPAEPVTKP